MTAQQATKKERRRERRKRMVQKIRLKHRLVILDESSFAEKFSLRLSPMNLFIWVGSFAVLLVVGTTFLIAYTPLREFIPGYPDGSEKQQYIDNRLKTDSLEREIKKYEDYVANIKSILNGETQQDTLAENRSVVKDYKNVAFNHSPEDSVLRKKVEEEEKYNLQFGTAKTNIVSQDNMYGIFFFTPLDGTITQSFDPRTEHFGIDIVTGTNDAIKSTLDGTVVFADWTADGGQEIHVQHANNLISIYKHNSVLLKKAGDVVNAGDPIAIVGNTGKLSEGPHLHFELWFKGKAIDPQNYLIL